MNKPNSYKIDIFIRYLILGVSLLFFSTIYVTSVKADTKEEVLADVTHFLEATKSCNIDEMMKFSHYYHNVMNVKEFYTKICEEFPLQQAKITDLKVINNEVAAVSIESTYKDRISINTKPVIQKNGEWKIINGISGPEYIESSGQRDHTEAEVENDLMEYAKALKDGNKNKVKEHLLIPPQIGMEHLTNHLQALNKEQAPEVTPLEINMINDSVAIVQLQAKYSHFQTTSTQIVYKENGQWKVVFGVNLVNSSIPNNGQSVEIN
ncbi:hypothetical protein WAK64_18120 [Bacillus spongiae]|uniref:DUF4878 domain-containing protein n=1 Tax=Bacillus spongiae TaxID=2683610 RepID=A0ABU8HIK7_9BACI